MAKKKISGLPLPSSPETVLAYAVGGIALYFLVGKPILTGLGILKDTKKEDSYAAAINQDAAAVFATQSPTKSDTEWKGIADIIYEDLRYSAISDNKADAVYQLCRVKNDADVYKLLQQFGVRQECYLGVICYSRSLQEFIAKNLSREQIETINNNYLRGGIKYRW